MRNWYLLAILVLVGLGLAGCGNQTPGDIEVGEKITTASGLKFELLEAGDGENPRSDDIVVVDYVVMLEDETIIDSSMFQGGPATFELGQGVLLPGWEEGIAMMRVGDRARLTIPPNLAYGAAGMPPDVPPDATLIVDLTLVGIQE